MKKILFLTALCGWTSSLIVHIYALSGDDLTNQYPFVMILHVGVFLVWIPSILILKNDPDYKALQQEGLLRRSNPLAQIKIFFKNTPVYLKAIAIIGFVYAPINFMIAYQESAMEINSARLFSGHCIAFYGIALGILYPFKRAVVL